MQKQRPPFCNGSGGVGKDNVKEEAEEEDKEEEEEEEHVKRGQLVISPERIKTKTTSIGGGRTKTTDMVMMTLLGTYKCRAWEHDSHFQRELERFVEDALQFQLCLNTNSNGGDIGGGSGRGDEACDHVVTHRESSRHRRQA